MTARSVSESDMAGLPLQARRETTRWLLYAWAFHGFVTTVATVIFGPYLTGLAQAAVGENGPVFGVGLLHAVTAKAFFFYCLSASVLLQVFLLPWLGAIADYTTFKKRMLVAFSSTGAGLTCLLFFVGGGLGFRWGGLLFAAANLSFGASVVLYNAFLPEIAEEDQRDRVSSRGYALGYLGGGVLLAANLLFIRFGAPSLGLAPGLAIRLCLLSAGLWWALFSLPMCLALRPRAPKRSLTGQRLATAGLGKMLATLRQLRGRPQTRRYLIAYLLYNDGIQTVISVAAVFMAQELFVRPNKPGAEPFLLGVMLMVQFVGFIGALVFERVASWTSAKAALVASLIGWAGVVLYGYAFMSTTTEAVWMSAVIAAVLGGSQALSRSLFSRMIPAGHEACFFAIYEISESGTSWIGPLVFAVVVAMTNSYRNALLSLLGLLVLGTVLLIRTNVETAFAEARVEGGEAPRVRPTGRPSWVLRLLDQTRGWIARAAVHVFFREVTYRGQERIPEGSPVLLVANHNNAVVDSFLLLSLGKANPRILAKSSLFSHPFMGPLLRFARALPVYRPEDRGVKVADNLRTFSRCREILAGRGCVALFPEGTSHNLKRQLPLRTGAARIVLEAEHAHGPLGIQVVPVALGYEAKGSFRSRAWVGVGQPFFIDAFAAMYRTQPVRTVRSLTERIAEGLREASTQQAHDEVPATPRTERSRFIRVLSAPFLLMGCILNWLPYRIPGFVSRRLARTADEPGTYKLITGMLVFPLVWIAEVLIACHVAGPFGGLAVAVAAPASGYVALRLRDEN